ncbi:MAG TPA: hypothetical protein VGI70_08365, partial [Polyangiales bacterium]
MEPPPLLPLPLEQLPAALQRFCNPQGPTPARLMAAKGLVPVRGADQITMLAQLANDPEEQVRASALDSLINLPESVLQAACDAALPPAVLHFLARVLKNQDLIGRVLANQVTLDVTIEE